MNKTRWSAFVAVVLFGITALFTYQTVQVLRAGAASYLFGYSLVLMNATKESMTAGQHGAVPLNHFLHARTFPDHDFRQVVRPNNDTLYSMAWIDLSNEPLVLSVPAIADRYYVMPLMDAWTNVFASVGTRTTGTQAGNFMIAGPNWLADAAPGLQLIRSPTNMVWLIGRIQTNTAADYEYVRQLQEQFGLTPLSDWGTNQLSQGYAIDQSELQGTQDNPSARVEEMSAGEFFAALSRLMGEQPPADRDGPMLRTLAEFGIKPGKPFELEKLGFFRRTMLERAVALTRNRLKQAAAEDRSSENGWAVVRDGIGVYGDQYQVRAFVSLVGLGALAPEEAAYPNSQSDSSGQTLSGEHKYRIRFAPGQTPPVSAFWSLTVYDQNGFLVDNPIKRYAIGDRDALKYNDDGSLDILIQHAQPEGDHSNWLPAPPDVFAVTMRLYVPKPEFLNGRWKLPPIERR